jgi:hypothetical protein
MIRDAQQRASPFYVTPENQDCKPGAYEWGGESPKVFKSGGFGVATKLFTEARANNRIYQQVVNLDKEIIKYISFSPLEQLPFEPDLFLVLTLYVCFLAFQISCKKRARRFNPLSEWGELSLHYTIVSFYRWSG